MFCQELEPDSSQFSAVGNRIIIFFLTEAHSAAKKCSNFQAIYITEIFSQSGLALCVPSLIRVWFFALLPTPQFASFVFGGSSSKRGDANLAVSNLEIRTRFQAFAAPLINEDISDISDIYRWI